MKLTLKKGNTLVAAFLLVAFLSGFWPAPQPVAAYSCSDRAQFVADVTIPDGTYFTAGQTFNKTWRLKNVGTCTWSSGAYYTLVFVDGTQMGATTSVNLTISVAPWHTIDLTVPMTAPSSPGTYRGNWQLKNASGYMFGIGAYANRSFWVEIRVGGVIPTPVPTLTPGGATATTNPGTSACDRATFINDVNVPDGSVFAPNTAFTKTWRIKNTGSCTWTTSYKLVFISGDKMSGPDSQNLTSTVGPNTSFDISVPLTSPASAGSYRGYWQFKNAIGQIFGIGYLGNKPWWVDIYVSSSATPVPPTAVTPATPTPVTPTPVPPTPVSGVLLDFTLHPELAEWKNGSGALLTFGGMSGDAGYAYKAAGVQLEDGITYAPNSLVLVPENITTGGYIQGTYPSYTVQSGDRFKTRIGCMSGYPDCNVKYWLYFKTGGGTLYTVVDYSEAYDTPTGLTRDVDLPLTSLVGLTGNFILAIGANGSPTGDHAPWVYPRIEHP